MSIVVIPQPAPATVHVTAPLVWGLINTTQTPGWMQGEVYIDPPTWQNIDSYQAPGWAPVKN